MAEIHAERLKPVNKQHHFSLHIVFLNLLRVNYDLYNLRDIIFQLHFMHSALTRQNCQYTQPWRTYPHTKAPGTSIYPARRSAIRWRLMSMKLLHAILTIWMEICVTWDSQNPFLHRKHFAHQVDQQSLSTLISPGHFSQSFTLLNHRFRYP